MKLGINSIYNIIVITASILSLFPFIMLILCALNTSSNIKKGAYLPSNITNNFLSNINILLEDGRFIQALSNTLIIAIITTIIVIITSLSFCYVIYSSNNKIISLIIKFLTIGIFVPTAGIIVPLFKIVNELNLMNTLSIVVLIELPLSFTILLFYFSSKKFPYTLVEAARIDGINELRIFYQIYLKGMYSTIVMAAITAFISSWNNLIIPLVLLDSSSNITLPIFLSSLNSITNPNMGVIMLALLLNIFPPLLLFLIFQKRFREGINLI